MSERKSHITQEEESFIMEKSNDEVTKHTLASNVLIKVPSVGKVGDKIDPSKSPEDSINYFFS